MSDTRSFTFGRFKVWRVEESHGPGNLPSVLLPDCQDADIAAHADWLVPRYFDPASGRFMSSVHTWVIQSAGFTLLVDTCGGNHKVRARVPRYHLLSTDYLQRLRASGIDPEEVDAVFCTHLHLDHVGWNTTQADGRWVPTFPNARYLFVGSEIDRARHASSGNDEEEVWRDSLSPVIEAGLAVPITCPHEVAEGLRVEAAPGHTSGHAMLVMRGRDDEEALFVGDAIHHPLQIVHPGWNSAFCEHAEQAAETRRNIVQRAATRGSLLCPAHFGWPHVAKVGSQGSGNGPVFPDVWVLGNIGA